MICIYHNKDLDGFCSAAIVRRKYPEAKFIGYDYGQQIPWDDIPAKENVMMVDVSFDIPDMHHLAENSTLLTWIDHHISKYNDYQDYLSKNGLKEFINVVFDNEISACEGVWRFLFPSEELPPAVLLLGKYDTWRQDDNWQSQTLPFQYGMRAVCNSLDTFNGEFLEYPSENAKKSYTWYHAYIDGMKDAGRNILSYQNTLNAAQCEKNAFEAIFDGYRAICWNGSEFNSNVFNSIWDESKYDIMLVFQFRKTYWGVSIYTTKDIDCSAIAKQHGGGGHAKAAGFVKPDMEWLLREIS